MAAKPTEFMSQHIAKFYGTNFHLWKLKMQMVLEDKRSLGYRFWGRSGTCRGRSHGSFCAEISIGCEESTGDHLFITK